MIRMIVNFKKKVKMKNLTLIFVAIACISCKAQTIVPLFGPKDYGTNNEYYKDTLNDLDKFIGIWEWSQGGDIWTIEIRKELQVTNSQPLFQTTFFEDLLIGEYRYLENGTEIVNTLNLFNDPNINGRQHSIRGNQILNKHMIPKCDTCPEQERRTRLYFKDPTRDYLPLQIILRYEVMPGGQERLQVYLLGRDTYIEPFPNAPNEPNPPMGEYILTKQ